MRNTIELKRANLILRALHIAVKNARYAKFNIHSREMVKEIPDYAMPAEDHVGTAALGGPGRAAAVPDARVPAARVNDELSIHEDSIAPEPVPPKRRPDPARDGKTRQQLLDEYFGRTPKPSAAAPPATPTAQVLPNGTADVAADALVRRTAPAHPAANKKPPLGVRKEAAPQQRKANARPSA
jgi:hypothetical protein